MEELAVSIVASMPASVDRLTADLSAEQLRARPAPNEWCVLEIAGHLIDKTEAWGERLRRIAAEEKPVLPAFDQVERVRDRAYIEADVTALLARLRQLATELVTDLRHLPTEAWARQGIHEERGVLTLGEACRIYAISIPEHMAQLVTAREAATLAEHLPGRPGA
ncbi:MAG: DinB family protein [Dehalococcoidia bacterium]